MIPTNVLSAKPRFSDLLRQVHLTPEDTSDIVMENDAFPEIQRLSVEGKLRIPAEFGQPWDVEPVLPVSGDYVGALKALLDEREEGR